MVEAFPVGHATSLGIPLPSSIHPCSFDPTEARQQTSNAHVVRPKHLCLTLSSLAQSRAEANYVRFAEDRRSRMRLRGEHGL